MIYFKKGYFLFNINFDFAFKMYWRAINNDKTRKDKNL